MGKKLERLRQWLPWADRAVGAPGAVGDWKELAGGIAKRLVPGGAAGSTMDPEVRGWAMDNLSASWLHHAIVWGIVLACLVSCVRYIGRERCKTHAQAQAQRLARRTLNQIAPGETEISPEDAWRIATHEHAGYVLVEEFIRQHPEACQQDPPKLDRDLFVRWLVASRVHERFTRRLLGRLENDSENG
ncbi:MAG: hypothetical protein OXQ94_08625 [Gemmatimonadota bacterium]|nr:hypothetical protein [Gemmatimonadota bacterium]